MSQTFSEDNPSQEITSVRLLKTPGWFTSFRRTQLGFGLWGLIIITGGLLQSNYSKIWGMGPILWVWGGLTLLGLAGTYLLNRYLLSSGMLMVWAVLMITGFALTLWLYYGLNASGQIILPIMWHAVLMTGYLITGLYMDRRIWWLAGWEALVIIATLLLSSNSSASPVVTPTPTPKSTDSDYSYYHGLVIDARIFAGQFLGIDLSKNLSFNFGLSSGIPLLIAALPFWKERYAQH